MSFPVLSLIKNLSIQVSAGLQSVKGVFCRHYAGIALQKNRVQILIKTAHHYVLQDHEGQLGGELIYDNADMTNAAIRVEGELLEISYSIPGKWVSVQKEQGASRKLFLAALRPGGTIYLNHCSLRRYYSVRKSGKYNGRFDLVNRKKEELLTIHPLINWKLRGHEYRIQLNEEYRQECSSLLILQAVHCVNCLLGIINGTAVPALVDI